MALDVIARGLAAEAQDKAEQALARIDGIDSISNEEIDDLFEGGNEING